MPILNTYQFLQETQKPETTYVIFARHGESESNALKRVGGSSRLSDVNLTEKGMEEAQQLGEALAPFRGQFKTIYSSPLNRAHQTASIALKAMGSEMLELNIDERIKEKFFGKAIDGQPHAIYNQFAEKEKAETEKMSFSQKWGYAVVEDAEKHQKVYERVKAFMLDVAKKHPKEIVLAFGHKVSSIKIPVIGALMENGIEVDYRDPSFNPINCSTVVFAVDPNLEKIELIAIDGFTFSLLANQYQ